MNLFLTTFNTLFLLVAALLLIKKRQADAGSTETEVEHSAVELNNKQKLYNLLDNLQLPTLRIDSNGFIISYNNRAKEIMPGLEIGKISELDLIVGSQEPQLPFKEAFIKREVITKKLTLGINVYEMRVIPIYEEGSIDGFYEILTDITELEELRKAQEQHSKLETIGQFSMGMAHDFNNILQVILGNAELCLDYGELEDENIDYLETIIKAGNKASALIKYLLMFSRKQEVEHVELDVNQSLIDMRKMISRLIGENIKINLQLSDKPIKIKVDKTQYEQIVLNLCLNARDAMQDGGAIQISTEKIEVKDGDFESISGRKPGHYLKLSVADSGIGMSQEEIDKIFEPYYTTKYEGKGTGLGLANVQSNVSQSGGFIDIESNVGFGTVFKIYLPLVVESTTLPSLEDGQKRDKLTGHNEKVLLIEDDDLICDVTLKILRKNKFTVIACKDIASATKFLKEKHDELDLIISDFILPDGDGCTLYHSLKRENSTVPFIITSGYAKEKAELNSLIEDGVMFLRKPFSSQELLSTIHATLAQHKNENSTE